MELKKTKSKEILVWFEPDLIRNATNEIRQGEP
jgi:hypothetical protein